MIDIIKPKIFDENLIISGVTQKNSKSFPPYGFTVSGAEIANDEILEFNRKILAATIGINRNNLFFQKQIHSDLINIVDSNKNNIYESDGMITNEVGIFLSISIADCAAVLMYDQINKVIAGVHSGWRGTMLNIVPKAIGILTEKFLTNPADLLVYISPCAGGKSYEVDYDVARHFPNSVYQISDSKYFFDNKNEIKNQLIQSGILESNIEISPICTITDNQYHSFRRDKKNSGRMSAFIGMIS